MCTLQPEDGNPVPLREAQLAGRRLVSHPAQTPGGGGASKTAAQRQGRVAAL